MTHLEKVSIPVMPAIPWDTTEYCCNLEGGFIASLLGLGEILKLYRMWDGTDEEIETMMEQVEKGLQALMGGYCCDGVLAVTPTRSGYTRVTYQNGDTTLIVDKSAAELAENFPADQPTFPAGDSVCAGARMLTDRILADLNFSLQQAELVILEFELAASTAVSLLNMMAFAGAPIGAIIDPWAEWVFDAGDVGIATIKVALNDPAVRDKMTENIYCGVMESGDHQLTMEIYNGAMADLPLLTSTSTLLAAMFRAFDTVVSADSYFVAERYYNLGTLNTDNTCAAEFECDEEVFCFLVPSEEPDGVDYNNAAITLITNGWENSSNVSTSFVRVNFAEQVKIHSITGQARHTAANNADQAIRLNLLGTEQMRALNLNDDSIYGWANFEDLPTYTDPYGTVVDQIVFQAYADGVGTIQWQNVRVCFSYVT